MNAEVLGKGGGRVGVADAATAASMAAQGAQWVQLSGAEAYLWQRFEQLSRQARETLAS